MFLSPVGKSPLKHPVFPHFATSLLDVGTKGLSPQPQLLSLHTVFTILSCAGQRVYLSEGGAGSVFPGAAYLGVLLTVH